MQSCKIEKVDGRLTEESLHRLRLAYHHVPDGEYENTIQEWKDSKTLQQLRFIHGVVFKGIADYTGMTPEDVKDELKRRYGLKKHYIDTTGQPQERIVSLADYDIHEMSEFIEQCLAFATTELGFEVDGRMRALIDQLQETV